MGVIERAEGRYEVQNVEFGRVYKWRPEQVVVEWVAARERPSLPPRPCRCGADHAVVVREGLVGCSEDEALHPWRYDGDREDTGIPY